MNLFKSFSVYSISGFINAVIPFFLLPILTTYLSENDYGIISLFGTSIMMLMPFVIVGSTKAVNVEYFRLKSKEFKSYLPSSMVLPFIMAIFFTLVSIVFYDFFNEKIGAGNFIFLIPVLCITNLFFDNALVILRNEDKPFGFVSLQLTKTIIEISLTFYLVVYVSPSWKSRVISLISASLVLFIITFFVLNKRGLLRLKNINKIQIFSALMFGLPLVPERLSVFVLNSSDKFFIKEMTTNALESVAQYHIGALFGLIVLIIGNSFFIAFNPILFSNLKLGTNQGKKIIVKSSYIFIGALLLFSCIWIFASKWVFKIFVDTSKYYESVKYIPYISFGYFFWSCSQIFIGTLMFIKKSKLIMFISLTSLSINLVLNYFFINLFGTIGAAYATLISYFCGFLVVVFFSTRLVKLPWLKTIRLLKV